MSPGTVVFGDVAQVDTADLAARLDAWRAVELERAGEVFQIDGVALVDEQADETQLAINRALDPTLAYRRHYPSVNWNRSYSLYLPFLAEWLEQESVPLLAEIT